MKTTNAFDSNAAGRAIAIALFASIPPETKARLAAKLRQRQANRTLDSDRGTHP